MPNSDTSQAPLVRPQRQVPLGASASPPLSVTFALAESPEMTTCDTEAPVEGFVSPSSDCRQIFALAYTAARKAGEYRVRQVCARAFILAAASASWVMAATSALVSVFGVAAAVD